MFDLTINLTIEQMQEPGMLAKVLAELAEELRDWKPEATSGDLYIVGDEKVGHWEVFEDPNEFRR